MLDKNMYFCITLLLTLLHHCASKDAIPQNQTFKDGDVLVSSGNNFAFGFFSPGNSKKRYVGIWYNKVSEQKVVWVANRDNPINGTTGVLSIENSGNLVLHDRSSNIKLWSTNVSGTFTSNSCFVQLMDTGNLMLFQDYKNTSIVSWQSFNYPTDTLIPHMKMGVNRTTGLMWSLTSWKSQDDPGTGDVQFKIDLNSSPPQFILYQNSETLYRSGPWNGIALNGVPQGISNFVFTYVYVENDDEVSDSFGIRDPSVLSRLTVKESGTLERLTWQEEQQSWASFWYFPKDQCDYYNHCGSFGYCDANRSDKFECECLPGYEPRVKSEWYLRNAIHGCSRKQGEQTCGNSSDDVRFIKLTSVKIPDTTNAIVNRILGLKECADLCIKNCSCTGYSTANVSNGGSGCITWYGDLIDTRQFSDGQDFYIRVTASELAQYMKNQKGPASKKVVAILVTTIGGALLLAFAIWLVFRKQEGKRKYIRKSLGFKISPVSAIEVSSKANSMDDNGDLTVFYLKTIIAATGCFALANKLGEGGFGSVYKGQLQNGREIAIKRLSKDSVQGVEEFKNEVTLISRLQHRNLVKLLGCCIQQDEKMLVYEYLPNKGLDNFIFDKENGALLDWRKRFEIILGIARGIVYLHRDSRLRIIHRDLKASNILLDANMEPKISDFGMARIFGTDQMVAKTQRVVGTYGYMSPEYAMQGLFSEKSDVFSYGVLLLEIISGRKNNSYFSENSVNLTGYVWDVWKEGAVLDVVDPAMGSSYNHDDVGRCIHIGLLGVQEHARDRPTMSEVLSMLCKETSLPSASPKQPAFVIKRLQQDSSYTSEGISVDDASISIVEPR